MWIRTLVKMMYHTLFLFKCLLRNYALYMTTCPVVEHEQDESTRSHVQDHVVLIMVPVEHNIGPQYRTSMVVPVRTDGASQPMGQCHMWYIKKKALASKSFEIIRN